MFVNHHVTCTENEECVVANLEFDYWIGLLLGCHDSHVRDAEASWLPCSRMERPTQRCHSNYLRKQLPFDISTL